MFRADQNRIVDGGAMNHDRYSIVDSLRLFAASAVMLYHLTALNPAFHGTAVRFPELSPTTRYFYLGVELFFIISGFVISLSARGRSAPNFLLARGRRLYPAFWVSCTIAALVTLPQNAHAVRQYFANMTLIAPYLGEQSIDGVYWTLYMEIRFYLFVAVILALGQERRLITFMAGWLALSVINIPLPIPRGLGLLNLAYAPLFVAGTVYAQMAAGTVKRWHYGLLAGAIVMSIVYQVRDPFPMQQSPATVAVILLGCHGLMWAVATRRLTMPDWPILLWAGGLSYPIYLLHNEVGQAILSSMSAEGRWSALVLASTAVLVMAWLVHGIAERAFWNPRQAMKAPLWLQTLSGPRRLA